MRGGDWLSVRIGVGIDHGRDGCAIVGASVFQAFGGGVRMIGPDSGAIDEIGFP